MPHIQTTPYVTRDLFGRFLVIFAPLDTLHPEPTTVPGSTITLVPNVVSSPTMDPMWGTLKNSSDMFTYDSAPGAIRCDCDFVPYPKTQCERYECAPMVQLLMSMLFLIIVNGSTRTLFPMLVDGNIVTFGPISHPSPISTGPYIVVPERMTVSSPMPTGPCICTWGSIFPEVFTG